MSHRDHQRFLEPYREAIRRFGPGFEATLWASREAQVLRFDVFIELAGLDDAVVLDVGCGPGDFALRLIEKRIAFRRYIGIDALAEMIDTARGLSLDRCAFHVADVLGDPGVLAEHAPDVVCISGTLNTMDEDFAMRLVERAFAAAKAGVVFNFLSNRRPTATDDAALGPARRFDTLRWIDWALEQSPCVSFTQEYLNGHDATIAIWHPDARSPDGEDG